MAVGNNGRILKTTDGGDNWTLLTSGVTSIINTIIYLSSDTLIAGTVNGKILRSVEWAKLDKCTSSKIQDQQQDAFTNYGHAIFQWIKALHGF